MISLSNQLKDDFISLFADNEEYGDMIVKPKYELYPSIHYPMITIEEISNDDVNQYHNDNDVSDPISYLAYQIEISAEQSEDYTALENVDRIGEIIDNYMHGERYRCMRRTGNFIKVPMQSDNNIMVGYLRYECYIDKEHNTIYRRY